MHVTIAVCTWNRARLLRQTLDSMTRLRPPRNTQWELLVVDNRCSDATDDVLEAFSERLPLRRLYEPTPGLSNARNRAVQEAAGEYIIWTDDDVLVDPYWLAAYCEAFERWPGSAVFGGPITPQFEGELPPWLESVLPTIAYAFAARDLGPEPVCFTPREDNLPYGANYAIRSTEQRDRAYNPVLGRSPGKTLVGWEETELITDILTSGHEGRWVPDAKVRHYITPERQTISYLRRYWAGHGAYHAWRARSDPGAGPSRGWVARWCYALRAEWRYRLNRPRSAPEVWMEYLRLASEAWGQVSQDRFAKR